MTFNQLANSAALYIAVIIGLTLVLIYTIVFLRKGLKRCDELQIEKTTVKKIITSSLIYSIVPSISIVVGLATMTIALGVALPWWRLSVLGSLSYEMSAASLGALFMGYDSLGAMASEGDPANFVAIFFIMSIGLLIPLIVLLIMGKKISVGMINARKSEDKAKSDWSIVRSKTLLMTLMSCFIPMMMFTEKVYGITFIISMLLTVVFNKIIQKPSFAWVENFSLAFIMIISLGAAVGLYNYFY